MISTYPILSFTHHHYSLINAIQASRAYNSSTVASRPEVTNVKETATYCDAKPAQNITFIGQINTVRVFLDNTVAYGMNATQFLEANNSVLHSFVRVLHICRDIFSLPRNAIHIFYDSAGSTIAFNLAGSLFFNFRYFENLHLPQIQRHDHSDAIVYWFVVMAHELAHNLVVDHSSDHSFYTESLVMEYFGEAASKLRGLADPMRPG